MGDAPPADVLIRDSTDADIEAVTAIYAHHVLTGAATFEIDPPEAAEMARRRDDFLARGFPFLVAEIDGTLAGYAYASLYRVRIGYRFTVENSVYVAPGYQRRGAGRALLARLITDCEQRGYRQMIAVIGDSANTASIRLHESFGFQHSGAFRSLGFKFGRWIDTVLMQRPLGDGNTTLPE